MLTSMKFRKNQSISLFVMFILCMVTSLFFQSTFSWSILPSNLRPRKLLTHQLKFFSEHETKTSSQFTNQVTVLKLENFVKEISRRVTVSLNDESRAPLLGPKRILFDDLVSKKREGKVGVCEELCRALAEDHYAVISLNAEDQRTIHAMWKSLQLFFELDSDVKYKQAGEFRNVDGAVGVVGYNVMPDSNEFLETRLWPNGTICPSLNGAVEGFDSTAVAARSLLSKIGKAVIHAALESIGMDASALENFIEADSKPLEQDCSVVQGLLSATQHRFCRYSSGHKTSFGAHTDTTFLTLIPCSSIAGLEVHTEKAGWVRPEVQCLQNQDVLVLPGEVLQVFTADRFPAAVHRVLKAAQDQPVRISAPLLLRPNPTKSFQYSSWTQGLDIMPEDIQERLETIDGLNMKNLHEFLVTG